MTVKLQSARMHNWLNDWLIEYWIKSKFDWLFIYSIKKWLIDSVINWNSYWLMMYSVKNNDLWNFQWISTVELLFLINRFKISILNKNCQILFISLIFVPPWNLWAFWTFGHSLAPGTGRGTRCNVFSTHGLDSSRSFDHKLYHTAYI